VTRLLAGIDLGTNTVRALVAEADPHRGLRPLWADQAVTRLGEGLAARGTLAPAAVERTLAAVRRFHAHARGLGTPETLLVATAAVREAQDGAALMRRLQAEEGIRARVVTGEDEAALTLLGATAALGGVRGDWGLLDVGGGSTEFLVADGSRIRTAVSLRLGVVSLAERFVGDGPVTPSQLAACRTYVETRLRAELWPRLPRPGIGTLVATAGTATTLAALELGLAAYDGARVQGYRLSVSAVARQTTRLAAMSLAARARLPGLEPGRADVIVTGAVLLDAVLRGLALPEAVVSDAGLREGVLLDAVGWRPAAAPPAR
jgi:exopolyphosphatase/guanosine-5'-triphosphate,3'-diphosphate pyrophosphatase